MIEAIQVKLWDKVVGYLSWDKQRRRAVFKYDDSFLQSGLNPSPLDEFSTAIQANRLPHYGNQDSLYQGLPPFIADSLPDKWGNRVFAQWAEQHHLLRRQLTPLDRLAFMGNRGMGALEFIPSQMPADETMVVNASALYQTAQQIADERQEIRILNDDNILLDDLYRVGTSAGGRRPKAIIAINQSGTEIRSGQASLSEDFTYYILKFHEPQNAFPMTLVEMAYYDMACAAGVQMMPSQLWKIDGVAHFLTERFDRQGGQKMHMLTLAGINSLADSYDDLFTTCRRLMLPYTQMLQLYRRIVFNILACNVDDHTKNFSFLMNQQGQWSLAPAYDMTFSWDIGAPRYVNRHEMALGGKTHSITKEDLLRFASHNDIKAAETIYDEVAEVVSRWSDFAQKYSIDAIWIKRIQEVLERAKGVRS